MEHSVTSIISPRHAFGCASRVSPGLRVVSVLPESVTAATKQLKQLEPLVRARATFSLRALVHGAGGVGSSVHGEVLKAAVRAAADRCGPLARTFKELLKKETSLLAFGRYNDSGKPPETQREKTTGPTRIKGIIPASSYIA